MSDRPANRLRGFGFVVIFLCHDGLVIEIESLASVVQWSMTFHSRQDETKEWLNYLQPEGMVVGPNVLREMGNP